MLVIRAGANQGTAHCRGKVGVSEDAAIPTQIYMHVDVPYRCAISISAYIRIRRSRKPWEHVFRNRDPQGAQGFRQLGHAG